MTTIAFRTLVMKLPASPLGLLPARWTVAHWCAVCREEVAPDALVTHAQAHAGDVRPEGGTIE
ncbi:MAG: hypothetical protein ABR972_15450 [Acidimicrobiales bacterium]|jgi:DNA-binding transcriptional regulator PaaX